MNKNSFFALENKSFREGDFKYVYIYKKIIINKSRKKLKSSKNNSI